LGIPQGEKANKRMGQIPFGFEYKDFKLVKSKEEQEIIRMIRQYRVNGLSLRKIAEKLNQKLVPTKNCGVWQANTVRLLESIGYAPPTEFEEAFHNARKVWP
jgi:hypothetical protein